MVKVKEGLLNIFILIGVVVFRAEEECSVKVRKCKVDSSSLGWEGWVQGAPGSLVGGHGNRRVRQTARTSKVPALSPASQTAARLRIDSVHPSDAG